MSKSYRGPAPSSAEALQAALRQFTIGLLLMLGAALLLLFYASSQFRGLAHPEAIDQAQLGRNLFRGDGFTTSFIRPLSMWQFSRQPRWRSCLLDRHPDIVNPPLYPALIAGVFYLIQKGDLSPPETAPPKEQTGAKDKDRSFWMAVLTWPYWHWVALAIAVVWIIMLAVVGLPRHVMPESLPLHLGGILFFLFLFGLHWNTSSSTSLVARRPFAEDASPWDIVLRGQRPPSEEGRTLEVSPQSLPKLPPSTAVGSTGAAGSQAPAASRRLLPGAALVFWPYWPWVLLALGGGCAAWLLTRWRSRQLQAAEIGWFATALGACLALIVLYSLPRMSFEVGPQESFTQFGPDRCLVYGIGVPLTLLNTWLVYLAARRLFDRRTGIMAAGLFVLSDAVCQSAVSGLSVPLVMTWTLLAVLALMAADERREKQRSLSSQFLWLAASGALIGLAFMTKYAAGWLLLPACLLCWRGWGKRAGSLGVAAMLLAFLIVAGPWLARNALLSGSVLGLAKYGLLEQSGLYPGDLLQRMLEPKFWPLSPTRLAAKIVANGHRLLTDSPWVPGCGVILVGFIAALCCRFQQPRVTRLKWWTLGAFGVLSLVACALGVEPQADWAAAQAQPGNLPVLLAPLMAVFAAGFFSTWLGTLELPKLRRRCYIALAAVAAAVPLMLHLGAARPGRFAYPPYHPPTIHTVASYLEPNEFMTSDLPWAVAWYGDRRCIWLPFTPAEFYQINDHLQHVSALLATPVTLNGRYLTEVTLGEWAPWASILGYLHFPSHFPLRVGHLVVGMNLSALEWDIFRTLDVEKVISGVHMVLLCDRKRWISHGHGTPAISPAAKPGESKPSR